MFIAPLIVNAPSGLFGYLQEVNGAYSIPILTIIVVGYLTKYVPAIAAKISIISGSALYIISQFVLKPYVIGADNYLHYLHVMAILFIFNITLMLGIGAAYPRKEAYHIEATHTVSMTPYRYLIPVSVGITVLVIYIYYFFA